jgi:hypothetical protein
MLFILWLMQVLTQIAEYIRHQTSTRIAHCHSSLLYPQWKHVVCAKISCGALHGSVTCATASLFVNLMYTRCSCCGLDFGMQSVMA